MTLRAEWRMIRRYGWKMGWARLPLRIRTYLVSMLLVNGASSLAVGLFVGGFLPADLIGATPTGPQAPSGYWIVDNIAFVITSLFTFAGSVGVALWRLNILERDSASKESLKSGIDILSKDHELVRILLQQNTEAKDKLASDVGELREKLAEALQAIARIEGNWARYDLRDQPKR